MPEPTQYRIVEVDDPVYGSRYVIQYAHRTFFRNRLVHCQINANGPARCGLTNPQHRRKSGLDMAIQAEQGVTCHNLLDRALVWKELFVNKDGNAGDAIFFSFLMAGEALEKHLDEEHHGIVGREKTDPDATPEHEGFTDGGDIDF